MRRDRRVGVNQGVQSIFRHDLENDLPQGLHSHQMIRLRGRVQSGGVVAERSLEIIQAAGKHRHGEHVFKIFELGIAALAQVAVDRVVRFVAARLRGEHAQVHAAGAGRNQGVIERHRHDPVDGLGGLGKRRGKISRQPAGLEIGNQIGDRFVDVHRIDDRRTRLFHIGDRLVGDANILSIGAARLDHQIHAARPAFFRAAIFHR